MPLMIRPTAPGHVPSTWLRAPASALGTDLIFARMIVNSSVNMIVSHSGHYRAAKIPHGGKLCFSTVLRGGARPGITAGRRCLSSADTRSRRTGRQDSRTLLQRTPISKLFMIGISVLNPCGGPSWRKGRSGSKRCVRTQPNERAANH